MQLNKIAAALNNLVNEPGVTTDSLNVYTPGSLGSVSRGASPAGKAILGAVNILNGTPTEGESITLGPKAQSIILTGTTDARIVGHAANQYGSAELLIGNSGNDTIQGGGGSGSIFGGSGANFIRTGGGNVLVNVLGTDTVYTGAGADVVETEGTATVHAGAGLTVFTDKDASGGHSNKVVGGTGTLIAYSGLGDDTFVGGSGGSFFRDAGSGHVDFKIRATVTGTTVISGFITDGASHDTLQLAGYTGLTTSGVLAAVTQIGGSSYIHLGTTTIELVGVTTLNSSDISV
jgi:Ca2+-binding RTX toxin-like protein